MDGTGSGSCKIVGFDSIAIKQATKKRMKFSTNVRVVKHCRFIKKGDKFLLYEDCKGERRV
jgi:hypothetical protein